MNKILSTVLSLGLCASAALAADITAKKVSGSLDKVDATSSIWKDAKFSAIELYPQTAIEFNDKLAIEANKDNKAKKAQVAAVHNGKEIALLIKWADATKSVQGKEHTDSYSDGFAVQFVGSTKKPTPLPYIGMGSEGRPVVIHLQKATSELYEPNGKGDVATQVNRQQTAYFGKELADFDKKVADASKKSYDKVFVGEGFRTITEIKDATAKSNSSMTHANSEWSGVLSRALKDAYTNNVGTVPVSIAVWDGDKMGRNGLKHLSNWVAINLEGQKPNAAFLAEINEPLKGDAAKGKAIADEQGCMGCHQLDTSMPAGTMGPSLLNVGGYSTAAYLRESLLNPTAVIVPGYNRNAHVNTPWYNIEDGKRVSTMIDYTYLDEESIEHVVAYLKTLKAEVE